MIGSVMEGFRLLPMIYTKHASVEGCLISIVYALLPDKKESTYCRLLSILKVDSPKRVTIDVCCRANVQLTISEWASHFMQPLILFIQCRCSFDMTMKLFIFYVSVENSS